MSAPGVQISNVFISPSQKRKQDQMSMFLCDKALHHIKTLFYYYSDANPEHECIIMYILLLLACPRRYMAGNPSQVLACCRLRPARWWTPSRRRINGFALQQWRQTSTKVHWVHVSQMLCESCGKITLQTDKCLVLLEHDCTMRTAEQNRNIIINGCNWMNHKRHKTECFALNIKQHAEWRTLNITLRTFRWKWWWGSRKEDGFNL